MKHYEPTTRFYAAKWSPDDLCSDVKAELEELVASGEAFDTEWLSCDKVFVSWKMTRSEDDGPIDILLCCSMDENEDLVDDAFRDVDLGEKYDLTQEDVDNILQLRDECGEGYSGAEAKGTVPATRGLFFILAEVNSLYGQANTELQNSYEFMKNLVKDYFTMKEAGVNAN